MENIVYDDELFVTEIIHKLGSTNCNYSTHNECRKIQATILNKIHNGNIYPAKVLESYIKFLTKSYGGYYDYYYTKRCISRPENYIEALGSLISFHCPSTLSIKLLIDTNAVMVINKIIDNGYEIPESLLDYAITADKSDIADVLSKYDKIEVTTRHLELASSRGMLKTVVNILTRKISPTKNVVKNIIGKKNIQLVKTLLNLGGFELDTSLLIAACESKDYEIIKLFLDLKIAPTTECFKKLVSDNTSIYRYRYSSRQNKYNGKSYDHISDIIDLLVSYGYKITYDDVVTATKNHVKINNIEVYDIKLDEKFLEVCAEYNFYPYALKNINPTVKCLEKACAKAGNLTAIKDLVKKNVKPNTECLRQACKHKNNLQTIKFLISNGAKPDFQCVENLSNILGNRSLSYILNEYKKTINTEEKEEKKLIKNNENKNDNDKISDNELEKLDDVDGLEISNDMKDNKLCDSCSDESSKNNSDDNKINEKEIKNKKKILVKGKKTQKDQVEIINITKPNKEIKIKETYVLNDNLSLLLTKKKGAKMTYLEVKQKLLEYIKNNNLFDKNNKLLIKINSEINSISGYKVNAFMSFVDFDNFVANCITNKDCITNKGVKKDQ